MSAQTTKRPLEGITFEGMPLEPVVQEIERQEVVDEFNQEAGKYRRALKRGGRAKMASPKEQHGDARALKDEEVFRILIEKSGQENLERYLRLPEDTKLKLARLHKGLRVLKKQFITSEVKDQIKQLGMSDHQRFLYLLNQGGYLTRQHDIGRRVIHMKTDLVSTLDDVALAVDLMSKNEAMTGYPVQRGARKSKLVVDVVKHPVAAPVDLEVAKRMEPEEIEAVQPVQGVLPEIRPEPMPDVKIPEGFLDGLDQGDQLMVMDMVRTLKLIRQVMPKLSREDFLHTFIKGSGYVRI